MDLRCSREQLRRLVEARRRNVLLELLQLGDRLADEAVQDAASAAPPPPLLRICAMRSRYGAERSTRWLWNSCCICEKPLKPSALAKRIIDEGCTALASATVATVPSARSCGFSRAKREMRCSCGDSVG